MTKRQYIVPGRHVHTDNTLLNCVPIIGMTLTSAHRLGWNRTSKSWDLENQDYTKFWNES